MRTFGFIIFFFPVNYQDGSGAALRSHLRSQPFRRMPGLRTFTFRLHRNARANGRRRARIRKTRQKRRIAFSH
jgi:hypothetical protein